jgi:hypothetical protein
MNGKMKIYMPLIICVVLAVGAVMFLNRGGEGMVARTIIIAGTEGHDVEVLTGADRRLAAREGARLLEDQSLFTGESSFASLTLDNSSIVMMDENTGVGVSRVNSRDLLLTVTHGAVSVNTEARDRDRTIGINAANVVMGVRGTLFTVHVSGTETGERVAVALLEGSLDVSAADGSFEGFTMEEGNMLVVEDDEFELTAIDFRRLDKFTLGTVIENSGMLIENEIISEHDINEINRNIAELAIYRSFLGEWRGTYTNSSGINGLTLTVFEDAGRYSAMFHFYPVEGSPASQREGSYYTDITINPANGRFEMQGKAWIDRPSGWIFGVFTGVVDGDIFTGHDLSNAGRPMFMERVRE